MFLRESLFLQTKPHKLFCFSANLCFFRQTRQTFLFLCKSLFLQTKPHKLFCFSANLCFFRQNPTNLFTSTSYCHNNQQHLPIGSPSQLDLLFQYRKSDFQFLFSVQLVFTTSSSPKRIFKCFYICQSFFGESSRLFKLI